MFIFKLWTKAETIWAENSSVILLLPSLEPEEPRSFASSLLVLVSVQGVRLAPEPGLSTGIARNFLYALVIDVGMGDKMAGFNFPDDRPASLVLVGYL